MAGYGEGWRFRSEFRDPLQSADQCGRSLCRYTECSRGYQDEPPAYPVKRHTPDRSPDRGQRKGLTFFADDGRMFFAIPMANRTCIGTTDTRVDTPDTAVTDQDRDYILSNINARLNLPRPLMRSDIIAERCGVRPLVVPGESDAAMDFSPSLTQARGGDRPFEATNQHLRGEAGRTASTSGKRSADRFPGLGSCWREGRRAGTLDRGRERGRHSWRGPRRLALPVTGRSTPGNLWLNGYGDVTERKPGRCWMPS